MNHHYSFKIKTGKGILPRKHNNVEITNDFLPQQEILFDKNTRLFISHCGQNSINEAIYAGVPLICIPNSGDQFYNSSLVEHLGIGIYVPFTFKNEKGEDQRNENVQNDFQNALNEMLNNKIENKYLNAVNELREKVLSNVGAKDIFLQKIVEIIGE
uniref:UDP-glucuronosyltransferase n=1 Tax=Meloidogyne enterolobii TaxID=390850 RepID=A0A6V7VBB5_MELEN|nr:unnamed protein product [Meloidogyne enterolobii]